MSRMTIAVNHCGRAASRSLDVGDGAVQLANGRVGSTVPTRAALAPVGAGAYPVAFQSGDHRKQLLRGVDVVDLGQVELFDGVARKHVIDVPVRPAIESKGGQAPRSALPSAAVSRARRSDGVGKSPSLGTHQIRSPRDAMPMLSHRDMYVREYPPHGPTGGERRSNVGKCLATSARRLSGVTSSLIAALCATRPQPGCLVQRPVSTDAPWAALSGWDNGLGAHRRRGRKVSQVAHADVANDIVHGAGTETERHFVVAVYLHFLGERGHAIAAQCASERRKARPAPSKRRPERSGSDSPTRSRRRSVSGRVPLGWHSRCGGRRLVASPRRLCPWPGGRERGRAR